ncbi:hypothetical protein QNE40_001327 [Vibrio alginolyticus]|nr:hypothetical protein [Vibrio alginolyticus]
MAHLVKSKTVEGAKNKWATRWDCFFDAQFLFRRDTGKEFVLDVAAEPPLMARVLPAKEQGGE